MEREDDRFSVAKADRLLATNPVIIKYTRELFDVSERSGHLRAFVDGLIHRRDMLIQISSRQKAEMTSH